jgi:hypothetical protein
MKFLISVEYLITGTDLYAEGFYQSAIGDFTTKIYLRATITGFKDNVISFRGDVSIQPAFGLASILNQSFSGDGRIEVAQMSGNLFRVTGFYMETGSDKLELDGTA